MSAQVRKGGKNPTGENIRYCIWSQSSPMEDKRPKMNHPQGKTHSKFVLLSLLL
jgi:hypothetical protein